MNDVMKSALLAGLLVVGSALGADAPKTNLQLTMLTKVNPQGLALWDITNKSQDDNGNLDGRKLTPASWAQLLEIGKALKEGGKALATSSGVIVALPGAKLQDEGNTGASKAADVQRYVDAKPAEFREHAQELTEDGRGYRRSRGETRCQEARSAIRLTGRGMRELPQGLLVPAAKRSEIADFARNAEPVTSLGSLPKSS